jgi:hypothetical protein
MGYSPLRIAGIPPAARTEPGAAGTVAVRIAGVPPAMQIFGETRESQDSRTAGLEILQKDTEYNEEATVTKGSPLRSPWQPSVKKEPAEKRVSKIMNGKIIGGEISDSHDGFSSGPDRGHLALSGWSFQVGRRLRRSRCCSAGRTAR